MIDTTKVVGRRPLSFANLDAMLADARACVASPQLRPLGNWTLGQALNHLAAWIEYPYTGFPPELVFPESVKAQALAAKDRIMRDPMRPGDRLPGAEAGTFATEDASADHGLSRLEAAVALLRSAPPPHPDPAFGVVSQREWTEMNLRHAELHLSFFVLT